MNLPALNIVEVPALNIVEVPALNIVEVPALNIVEVLNGQLHQTARKPGGGALDRTL